MNRVMNPFMPSEQENPGKKSGSRDCRPLGADSDVIPVDHESTAPEDGRNYRPKQVELIEIINKPLLLHLVGYLYYWQMGFNSLFKGLI